MATVLQAPPCDDRQANGVAPWAAAATHGSALTPPSLWQYPAPVPVQLGGADHSPLPPPVGYQLVRDPLSGHLLLIPAANIAGCGPCFAEHLQRAVLWSGGSSFPTLQPQPQQHIQLFEHATEPGPTATAAAAAAETTTTTRILVQPQFTLTAADQPQPAHTASKKRTTVIKVEAADCTALEVKAPTLNRDMAATTPMFPTANIATTHFFYEQHPTASAATTVVQLAHTPQPPQSQLGQQVSQASSQAPPQTQPLQSQQQMLQQTPAQQQTLPLPPIQSQPSAAVQTETGKRSQATSPVNPAETCLTPPPDPAVAHAEEVEDPGGQPDLAAPAVEPAVTVADASNQTDTPPCSEDETTAQNLQPHVDVSGLELLSNSIEQFERDRPSDTDTPPAVISTTDFTTAPVSTSSDKSCSTVTDDKAVEMLQLLSVQKPHASDKLPIAIHTTQTSPSPTDLVSNCLQNKTNSDNSVENSISSSNNTGINISSNSCVTPALGGLGLLCALAEQRIMEEVGHGQSKAQIQDEPLHDKVKLSQQRSPSVDSGVDMNRSCRNRKSDRELKKSTANKALRYQEPCSEAASPPSHPQTAAGAAGSFCPQIQSPATSPPAAEIMDAMELNMRMQLAELQRRYREKQRELSRLTPKKIETVNALTVNAVSSSPALLQEGNQSPVSVNKSGPDLNGQISPPKRGPGRPRKRCNRIALGSLQRPNSRVAKLNRDLPPVLEKVTEPPRLKASKLDILKPPTLTANRPKLRPVAVPPDHTLIEKNNGNFNIKPKANGDLITAASKPEGIFGSDLEKHSAFSLCRLPCHTFGSKPSSRLPSPGDSDLQSWFKTSEKASVISRQQERVLPIVECSEHVAKLDDKANQSSRPLSSSKKRKVGRPKKHLLDAGRSETTETIVAKKPKSKNGLMGFLLSHSRLDCSLKSSPEAMKQVTTTLPSLRKFPSNHKPKIKPKLKAEAKVKTWSWGDDDDGDDSETEWKSDQLRTDADKLQVKNALWESKGEKIDKLTPRTESSESSGGYSSKQKLTCIDTKPTRTLKKVGITSLRSNCQGKMRQGAAVKRQKRSKSNNTTKDTGPKVSSTVPTVNTASETEGEDLPLSVYSNKCTVSSCLLTASHLSDKQRVLTASGGLFYAGTLSAIRPPDVYGISLDGERGNRQHIYSREEVLKDAILEVRPTNTAELLPGTRLCAYWSQQYRCLYPGTVAEPSTPDPVLDAQFVNVEFDDGDNGRINIDDIRLLPPDYPVVEYDPNPLLSLGKRRRRNSGTSCESHSKDRRACNDVVSVTSASSVGTSITVSTTIVNNNTDDNNRNTFISSGIGSSLEIPLQVQEQTEVIAPSSTTCPSVEPCATAVPTKGDTLSSEHCTDSNNLRERRRLKKRRRDKLKRLLSCSTSAILADGVSLKKRRRKHRCCDEHCHHKRHHRRHRRRRHRHPRDSGSDSTSKSGHTSAEGTFRISPVSDQRNKSEISPAKNQADSLLAEMSSNGVSNSTGSANTSSSGSMSEADEDVSPPSKKPKKEKDVLKPKKCRDRQPSVESRSKMAAFLPARQLWGWSGRGFKRPGAKGRGRKEFYKAIQRGKESIRVGDCAVFLSTGRPDRPYIGRIESMWEAWGTNMVVRVKWFYHPEETSGCAPLKYPGALFESPHVDENDVQTISHKCEVLPLGTYIQRLGTEPQRYSTIYDNNDIYYLAGYYDPTSSQLTMESGVM